MKLLKITLVSLPLILFFISCNNENSYSKVSHEKLIEKGNMLIRIVKKKEIVLDTGEDIIGFVALLTNWKNSKTNQVIVEFWSNEFKKIGSCEFDKSSEFVHYGNDMLITINVDSNPQKIDSGMLF